MCGSLYKRKALGYFLLMLSAVAYAIYAYNVLQGILAFTQIDFLSNLGLVLLGYSSFVLGERGIKV